MRRLTRILATSALCLLVYGQLHLPAQSPVEGWLYDYDKARELAKKTKKPILLVFR